MDVAASDISVISPLVEKICSIAYENGAYALCSVVSSPELVARLCQAGMWRVPSWMPGKQFYSVVRFNPKPELSVPSEWRTLAGWYQTLGDWDNL
jgi:hypothetical protein